MTPPTTLQAAPTVTEILAEADKALDGPPGEFAMACLSTLVKAVREAQAQEPEPVAWKCPDTGALSRVGRVHWLPLYYSPILPPAHVSVPEGWKMVPLNPTEEMHQAYNDGDPDPEVLFSPDGYRAMLAAAPPAPQEKP